MKKIFCIIFLAIIMPYGAYADNLSPYGVWQCEMAGNEGEATVNIDPMSHIFTIKLPIGSSFKFPFQTLLEDGDKTGLILLTPDHIAHPVDVVKTASGVSIGFYDIKELPAMQCKRPEEKAPVGY